jgi:beta-galactosidase
MEQQAGPINWGSINPGVRPGTVRLWTWHALAAGAEAVIYFRWRACLYGHEVHHSGLLKHDGSPDLGYHEVRRLATEAETLAALAAYPLEPAPIALLLDYEDGWALQMQPHRREFGYLHHLFVFYRAARQLGFPVDIVPYHADLTPYRLVIAGSAYLGTSAHQEILERYVRGGGHVLFGVRSGFKTATNTATDTPLPGLWRSLVGATVTAWHALPDGVGYGLAGEVDGIGPAATFWAEALAPATARPLACYTTGPFAGEAALTDNGYGSGRAFYLGFYPGFEQATALLRYLATRLDLSPLVKGLPADVLAYRRGPYLLLLNFGDETREVEPEGMPRITIAPRDLIVYPPHVRTDA